MGLQHFPEHLFDDLKPLSALGGPHATLGTHALSVINNTPVTHDNKPYWVLHLADSSVAGGLGNAIATHRMLKADVSFRISEWDAADLTPADHTDSNFHEWEKVAVNSGSWQEVAPVVQTGWDYTAPPTSPATGTTTFTMSWDLSGVSLSGGADLFMSFNFDPAFWSSPRTWIDNIRLVQTPEPATFALGGMALAGLAMFRKFRG